MGSNPINLAFRFILELCAIASMAYWGWTQHEGILQFVLAIGLPLVAMVIWGTFNVPDDPSRSGKAPVVVPGVLRLAIELTIFGVSILLLYATGQEALGWIFFGAVLMHYSLSYDRVLWLILQ